MTITALPAAPNRTTDTPQQFADKMDAFLSAMITMVTQLNADNANLNAFNGVSVRYTFDTGTADADPGAGKIRLGSATQNTATVVRFDLADANGNTVTTLLDTFDDSNSATKGTLRLQHATDPTKFLYFTLSSIATPAGYRNMSVTPIASSAASPFANGDQVLVSFTRCGDVGSPWTGGSIANRAYTVPVDVAFSATPTIDASQTNFFCLAALTANVTNVTINNGAHGQTINIRFVQDATGGRTVTLPASIKAAGGIETGASRVSILSLTYIGTANGVAVNRWEGAWMAVPA